jgi:hypothetical protein
MCSGSQTTTSPTIGINGEKMIGNTEEGTVA